MKHRRQSNLVPSLVPMGALILALAVVGAFPATAQDGEVTVETLIEKNLEAKGGRAKLESVESARLSGKMNMGGMEAPFVLEWRSPNHMRMELSLQGMTLVQAFDGETAWMINPFMGKADPEKMSQEDADMVKEQADFHGPLFNSEEKGYEVVYAGEEEVEGTPTYKLEVTKENGEKTYLYLDKEYFLEIQAESKRTIRGQDMESTTAIGDYKDVDGLMMAHSLDSTTVGGQGPGGGFNMTIEAVEINPELADERFAMPAPAPAPAEEETEGEGR